LRWKGSVFQCMWKDTLIYICLYFMISIMYRLIVDGGYTTAKQNFELLCVHCSVYDQPTPVAILTGFYVSNVVSRWWTQFMSIPWPDQLALKLVAFIPSKRNENDFKRNLRRAVMRYVNLSNILVLRKISRKVEQKFPTNKHLVEENLLLQKELEMFEEIDNQSPQESTWVPLMWAMRLITKAFVEKKIDIPAPVYSHLQGAFDSIERNNRKLLNYGWMNFPLAYTQVATVITSAYFTAQLFSKQFFITSKEQQNTSLFANATLHYSSEKPFDQHTPDFYFPLFLFVEFFCIMGWIKVAENLLNPFGDDHEDINVNTIINRNLQVSYLIVDQAEKGKVKLETDPFLAAGIEIPQELSPCPTPETSHKKLESQRSRVETEKPKSPLAETTIPINESEPVLLKQLKPMNSVEVIGEDEKAGLLDSTTSKPEKIV